MEWGEVSFVFNIFGRIWDVFDLMWGLTTVKVWQQWYHLNGIFFIGSSDHIIGFADDTAMYSEKTRTEVKERSEKDVEMIKDRFD